MDNVSDEQIATAPDDQTSLDDEKLSKLIIKSGPWGWLKALVFALLGGIVLTISLTLLFVYLPAPENGLKVADLGGCASITFGPGALVGLIFNAILAKKRWQDLVLDGMMGAISGGVGFILLGLAGAVIFDFLIPSIGQDESVFEITMFICWMFSASLGMFGGIAGGALARKHTSKDTTKLGKVGGGLVVALVFTIIMYGYLIYKGYY